MSAGENQHNRPSVSQAPRWVQDVSPEQAYLAGYDDGIDSMGNELARERSRPGGSFDQWADYQRLEEQNESYRRIIDNVLLYLQRSQFLVGADALIEDIQAALSNPSSTPYTWEVVNTKTTNSESVFTNREDAERRLAELPEGFAVVAFDSEGHAVSSPASRLPYPSRHGSSLYDKDSA